MKCSTCCPDQNVDTLVKALITLCCRHLLSCIHLMAYFSFFVVQLMLLVGESFGEYSESVCGAVVQIRTKGDKLAIWTKNAADQDANLSIG